MESIGKAESTLPGFEPGILLVDHVDAPFAPDDTAVFVPAL
jgi:hypothetical protein